MACSICVNPQAPAIAQALARGDSLRTIEAAFLVDKSTLSRHKNSCLTGVSSVAPPPELGDLAPLLARLDAIEALLSTLVSLALQPKGGGDTLHQEERPLWNRL